MANKETFIEAIKKGYTFKGDTIKIGAGILDGEVIPEAEIFIPLSTMNRHGLVAGATGGGKTKSFQMIAEGLSDASVPCLLMDIKGDLSGIAAAGTVNDKITSRYQKLKMEYKPCTFPVDLLTLSSQKGIRLRATVSEFGPVLMSKILGLNDTQGGVVAMIFKYCDDNKLPLLDLKDFIKVLQYAGNEGKKELQASYGNISTTSTGTILRKVIELQQQGADLFFGEKSFEVEDLMQPMDDKRAKISILRVTDIQDRPKLFSTFMLQMLAELYAIMPEEGDLDKPKLVIFIDEAHLIFQEASKALLDQINTVIKLIRSKGVGIYFCTQNPMDVPASILGQLGLKIQHSLRAFTAVDRGIIKQTAQNYPLTEFYKTEDLITQLGIGEALVTLLNEKGIPTPLAHVMMCTPRSRMDVLTDSEINTLANNSKLVAKYNQIIDSKSAYEMLTAKLQEAAANASVATQNETTNAEKVEVSTNMPPAAIPKSVSKTEESPLQKAKDSIDRNMQQASKGAKAEESTVEKILNNSTVKSFARTAGNIIIRGLLGSLGLGGRSKRTTKKWF